MDLRGSGSRAPASCSSCLAAASCTRIQLEAAIRTPANAISSTHLRTTCTSPIHSFRLEFQAFLKASLLISTPAAKQPTKRHNGTTHPPHPQPTHQLTANTSNSPSASSPSPQPQPARQPPSARPPPPASTTPSATTSTSRHPRPKPPARPAQPPRTLSRRASQPGSSSKTT